MGGGPTADEERVSRKHDLLLPVLHEPADAILGVARRVQRLDGDAADVERLAVAGCPSNAVAVLAADDGQLLQAEVVLLCLSSEVMRMMSRGGDLRAACFRLRGPSGCRRGQMKFLTLVVVVVVVVVIVVIVVIVAASRELPKNLLVGVDDGREVDLAGLDGLLQDRSHPTLEPSVPKCPASIQPAVI
ncbi:hypothetical protein CTA2_7260 [Colletotrichum tanaceti]|nr:hypothetical protein CTA2_7260 [Colletotrichum tanaceti]